MHMEILFFAMNSMKSKKLQINCFWYLHFAKKRKKQIENYKTKRYAYPKMKTLIIDMIDVMNKFV